MTMATDPNDDPTSLLLRAIRAEHERDQLRAENERLRRAITEALWHLDYFPVTARTILAEALDGVELIAAERLRKTLQMVRETVEGKGALGLFNDEGKLYHIATLVRADNGWKASEDAIREYEEEHFHGPNAVTAEEHRRRHDHR